MELFDSKTLIKNFHSFFEEFMQKDIRKALHEEKPFIPISFFDISEYNLELGDQLLANPTDVLAIIDQTLKQFSDDEERKIKGRLTTLPSTEKLMIRDIRSQHIGKLIMLEGLVIRKTDVRPRLTHIEFLCTNPDCTYSQEKLRVPQSEEKTKILKACPRCRAPIEVVNRVLIDSQNLVLGEIPEQLENAGDQPKRINVILQDDLVSPFKDSKTNPGSKVYVIGIVKEIQKVTRTGADSVNYDIVVDGNYIDLSEEDYSDIKISKEEETQIKELSAKDDVTDILVKNMAPSIYGHNNVKEAIILQLFGGAMIQKGDGIKVRGDIHVLLIGDPGAAKSQMLKAATRVAPKSSFVSGKSASGVGLTAAVVRDELMGGFALEAGAIVLASGGLCAIDELDKMSDDDTSAMHEALEQQCYHKDFELQFADGSSEKIGEYVERHFNENKNKIIQGINCEILDIKTKEILTTDFNKITNIAPKRISRHIAPKEYIKITYSNGRSITVTPEHPVFIYKNNKTIEIRADNVEEKMIAPSPKYTKICGEIQKLDPIKLIQKNSKITFPKLLNEKLGFYLGFYAAEGHNYKNLKNRTYEIGVSNTNQTLIREIASDLSSTFNTNLNINTQLAKRRDKATKDLFTARILSKPFHEFFNLNFPEFISKAPNKRIPQKVKMSQIDVKKSFLQGYFLGDGFYDSERCGFSTSSSKMAQDIQDMLLNLEISSYIATEKRITSKYYKVIINGEYNLEKFYNIITEKNSDKFDKYGFKKIKKIKHFLDRSKKKLNAKDTVPHEFIVEFNKFLKECHASDGYFVNLIKRKQNSHKRVVLKHLEIARKKLRNSKNVELLEKADKFEKFLKSEIKWIKVSKVEKIKNNGDKWVYDVTVPPTKTFISQGLVLHNTISVAKANIRATLQCQTTVLGAANPKMGRFDPYGDIAKQINFPPALISRFDLIFILRDIPDKKRDDLIAGHILETKRDESITISELSSDFLKKYIAYAKAHVNPILTPEASDKIKEFYVKIRNAAADDEEGGAKSVPITARQLEAIVRLSEAYAKIKLDKRVRVEYAQKAIDMMMYCLEKIGIDPKTGELDIDRITTGITTSTRNQYKAVSDIIDRLETEKPEITYDDICDEAEKAKIPRGEVQRILDKLKQEGIIFEPRKNRFKKLL